LRPLRESLISLFMIQGSPILPLLAQGQKRRKQTMGKRAEGTRVAGRDVS